MTWSRSLLQPSFQASLIFMRLLELTDFVVKV